MSASNELELAEAEARYNRERVALLRARLYGRGLGVSGRLEQLERELERSEGRVRTLRSAEADRGAETSGASVVPAVAPVSPEPTD